MRQLLILVALIAAAPVHGEGLDDVSKEKIDQAVVAILRNTETPSASVAVIKSGKIAYLHAYGAAILEPLG